jgi:hypothetical protein
MDDRFVDHGPQPWPVIAGQDLLPGLAGLRGQLDQPVPFGAGHAVQLEKGPNVPGLGAAPSGLNAEDGGGRPLQLPRDLLAAHAGGFGLEIASEPYECGRAWRWRTQA